ncbi:ABC transporter ATP-binding protein [Leptolyngbya sp. AN03gr2]|uniref:ABC transporter ATP-binding protein n=1 Tax=unclassified Leptolyngbya TaxID=2650499 RepID=UPI003D311E29
MQNALQQYRLLLADYLKPQWKRVLGLTIALLTSIALQIVNPQILGYFIDTAVQGGSQQALLAATIAFIAIALLTQGTAIVATYLSEIVAWTATNALRVNLAEHCLRLDLSFHKAHTPGELLERIDGDVNLLSKFFSELVVHVLGNSILLFGILIVLCFENRLAGISLTIFAIVALTVLLAQRAIAIAPWGEYRQVSAEYYGTIGEHIAGREDIRANGAVSYVMNRFYELLQRWLPVYQKARFASTVLWFTSVGLFTVGNAIALFLSAYLWSKNAITIGTAYLIFHYTNLLAQPIERIREELEQLQQVEASIQRIYELLNTQTALSDRGQAVLSPGACAVSFEQVYFRYESENWTLHNLSFHLPAGQTLGIIGHTGSGKSTIARLLLRLYDIQSGEIRLGDCTIADLPLSELRSRVGLVTQDVQLFQASVRDNLTFFNDRISDACILETLESLGLAQWLRSLPDGLNTQLGADSTGLSAGQAQLLALVRVFLKNPSLVILDEASSRLDPQTEKLIEGAIDQLLANRTGIIIAHRLQTLQRVNQILILEQGKIVEYGDRKTLVSQPDSQFSRLLKTSVNRNDL